MEVRYPNIDVSLVGADGNVFHLIGTTDRALRRAGVDKAERDAFKEECFNQESYDGVIQTIMRWVNVT